MSFNFTGNTDVDFARNAMIPHHEGAIDMAKVAQRTDAEIRKFAEKMIATKKNEIALLRMARESYALTHHQRSTRAPIACGRQRHWAARTNMKELSHETP